MLVTNQIDGAELSAIDLCEEIADLVEQGVSFETAKVAFDGKAEWAQVLYIPSIKRGGIAWGADADWSDASSMDDLLERYCEVDDKYMVN
jgi:hypothetical protein